MKKSVKGIWFYGLSGSGKTYASEYIYKFINNTFIIDGDEVRKHINPELGYNINDRKIQLDKVYGIAKLVILNKLFPIVSTVMMNNKILKECNIKKIKVVKIERPKKQIFKIREIYSNEQNVVGMDIVLERFKTPIIHNSGDNEFKDIIKKFLVNL